VGAVAGGWVWLDVVEIERSTEGEGRLHLLLSTLDFTGAKIELGLQIPAATPSNTHTRARTCAHTRAHKHIHTHSTRNAQPTTQTNVMLVACNTDDCNVCCM